MKIKEKMKIKKILLDLAIQEGCSVKQMRRSMQQCIDEAWNTAWMPGNLEAQYMWQVLFPKGEKPTLEEFLMTIGKEIGS